MEAKRVSKNRKTNESITPGLREGTSITGACQQVRIRSRRGVAIAFWRIYEMETVLIRAWSLTNRADEPATPIQEAGSVRLRRLHSRDCETKIPLNRYFLGCAVGGSRPLRRKYVAAVA